jgi:hypothetical protein
MHGVTDKDGNEAEPGKMGVIRGQALNRAFSTGATRNNDTTRIDWVKMLSLPAMFEYARYMRRHQKQADGSMREFDNWKGSDGAGGFPLDEVVESLVRHVLDLAALDRGIEPMRECELKETCCAIIFNAMAYLHTVVMKGEKNGTV